MKNVLIVDDDMINRKLLEILIKKNKPDLNILSAKNGLEALNIIKENDISMLFLDIIMPVMNGLDLLQTIKSDEKYKNIPVAILTTDDTQKTKSIAYGAFKVLIKPIKESEIIELLNQL